MNKFPTIGYSTEIFLPLIGSGNKLRMLCELLKRNATPTKRLDLHGDRKIEKGEKNDSLSERR